MSEIRSFTLAKAAGKVRPMEYPVLPGSPAPETEIESLADLVARNRELECRLERQAGEFTRQIEAARREALEQGKRQTAQEAVVWRQESAAALARAIGEFREGLDEYLARAEHEVVRLALAIAERIIRREAEMDPLLLTGAVRVALGQLGESTEVRLRIPAAQQEMWAEMLRLMPGLPSRPAVMADEKLQPMEAILEAALGRVDLSVRAQLAEIERGFFDLLDARNGKETSQRNRAEQPVTPPEA